MVGLVVVSHSAKAAEGICEVAAQMAPKASIEPAGGDGDGELGTSVDRIAAAIETAAANDDGGTASSCWSTSAAR
jgi:dihydroxyacetone kinase DhaKLM complex PTS-EIIA-like component DhaM